MPAFSVNIIARDSQNTIKRCLDSITGLSDDIVVVIDSRTTDLTSDTVRKFTSRVFVKDFVDFSSQRNFAVSKSVNDWIFTLDSDEFASPALKDFLRKFLVSGAEFSAYAIYRQNIIFGRIIRHTNWDPQGIVRLFNKNTGIWTGRVHEIWNTSHAIGLIKPPIIHDNYRSVEAFVSKLNIYTTAESDNSHNVNLFNVVYLPAKEFFRRYIVHAGFLDGYHGLFLSYLMWFYQLSILIKVWEKKHQK